MSYFVRRDPDGSEVKVFPPAIAAGSECSPVTREVVARMRRMFKNHPAINRPQLQGGLSRNGELVMSVSDLIDPENDPKGAALRAEQDIEDRDQADADAHDLTAWQLDCLRCGLECNRKLALSSDHVQATAALRGTLTKLINAKKADEFISGLKGDEDINASFARAKVFLREAGLLTRRFEITIFQGDHFTRSWHEKYPQSMSHRKGTDMTTSTKKKTTKANGGLPKDRGGAAVKTTNPKAPNGGKRGRPSRVDGMKIFLDGENYRKAGTKGHKTMEILAANPGITIEALEAKGGRRADVLWDLKHHPKTIRLEETK